MAKRSISNDDLGATGEGHFATICASAGFVANKSDRDRMGWDFLVERRPDNDPSISLDQRTLAPACRIQVKTVWKRKAARVALTLEAAERLSKPADPAFIVAFQAEERPYGPEIVAASLIHIRGKNLARILERLRSTSADDDKKLSDQEITFSFKDGQPFRTGRELAAALQELAGDDAAAYRLAKDEEIKNLGFDDPRYSVDITFHVEDRDHFLDALLGKREVEVRASHAKETRFDIVQPVKHLGELPEGHRFVAKFKPVTAPCTIIARSANGHTPIRLEGSSAQLPIKDIREADARLLFTADILELDVRADRTALRVGGPQRPETRLPLSSWQNLCRLTAMLGAGPVTFEISRPSSADSISIPWSAATSPETTSWASQLDGLLGRIDELTKEAGCPSPQLTEQEWKSAGGGIDALHRFWRGELLEPMVCSTGVATGDEPSALTFIRVLSAELGDARLAVAELLRMNGAAEGGQFLYRQCDRSIARVENVGHGAAAVEDFAKRVREMTEADGIMTIAND